MSLTVVRYVTHPHLADENEGLIREVFRELDERRPPGFRYLALRLPDGGFVHLAELDPPQERSPILDVAAFRAFQVGVRDRSLEPPVVSEARLVGNHRWG